MRNSLCKMPSVVWHVGVRDLKNQYWVQVVIEQALVLQRHKDVDVYLSMHATDAQKDKILDLVGTVGLPIKDTNCYSEGLWEVETLAWMVDSILPRLEDTDYIAYIHTKGATRRENYIRQYLMDHLMLDYPKHVETMRENGATTMGCFGILSSFEAKQGIYWCTFWIAQVAHCKQMRLERETRFNAESFMRFEIGRAMFADQTLTVAIPGATASDKATIPFRHVNGAKWQPSHRLQQILKRVQRHVKDHKLAYKETENNQAQKDWIMHMVYASVIAALLSAVVVMALLLRR